MSKLKKKIFKTVGKIVNYVNSTFAPRLITDYTAGTTSAAAQVYNPLACGQCCGGGNTFAGPAV